MQKISTNGQVMMVEFSQGVYKPFIVNNLEKYVVIWTQEGRFIPIGHLPVRKDNRFQ